MRSFHCLRILLLLLAAVLLSRPLVQAQDLLLPTNSTWLIRKGTNEASTPVSAWRSNSFNPASWTLTNAPFHYGTNSSGGDDALFNGTILGDMKSGYRSLFLRRAFVLTNIAEVVGLQLWANYDDGFVANILDGTGKVIGMRTQNPETGNLVSW